MSEEIVDKLAEEFLARLRRGERPSVTEYVERHPDLADDIRDVFPPLLLMEEAARPVSADRDAPARPLPAQLGEYRILREVGRGGMGVVYEAEQVTLGRHVALKVLPRRAGDERLLDRFRQEARAAARLHHTNIVPVFGVGEHQGTHYYAMQFIQGRGLDEVVLELRKLRESGAPLASGPLEIGDPRAYYRSVARIGLQVSEALAYAHKQGVLHRDIKPSNLLLDARGTVWVTDFGLAKEEGTDHLTQTGDIVGTIVYMAPERFHGWADPRSDVYSLGLTLYEMLVLKPAFSDTNYQRLLKKVLEEDPPPLRRLDATIPKDLETIVMKALAKEPGQRYRSANQLSKDLDRFLGDEPIRARRSTIGERVALWARRQPASAALVAVVLFSLAATVGGLIWHNARLAEQNEAKEDALRQARALGLVYASAAAQERDPLRALDLALEAARSDLTPESETRLREARVLSLHRHDLRLPEGQITATGFSPAGDLVCAASSRGTVHLWDLDGRVVSVLHGHEGRVLGASFSRDGTRLLTRGEDGTARTWSRAGEPLASLNGPPGMDGCGFCAATSRVWTHGSDGTLLLWDPGGFQVAAFAGPGPHLVHTTGCVVAVEGARVRVCDPDGSEIFGALLEHPVEVALLSPTGDRLVTVAGTDVRLWDGHGAQIAPLPGHEDGVRQAVFSPDGSRVVTVPKSRAKEGGRFYLWDPEGRLVAAPADERAPFWGVRFSPDGQRILAGTAGGKDDLLWLFDARGQEIGRLRDASKPPGPSDWWPVFSPDSQVVAVGPFMFGRGALLWWTEAEGTFLIDCERIRRIEFSPLSDCIAVLDSTESLALWAGREPIARIVLPRGVDSFRWSPTGEHILTTSRDGSLALCAAHAAEVAYFGNVELAHPWGGSDLQGTLRGDAPVLTTFAIAPGDDLFAVASGAGRPARFCDGTGHTVATPEAVVDRILLSPRGDRTVATIDRRAHLMDGRGREVAQLGDGQTRAAAFSADGSRVATGDVAGNVRVWDAAGAPLFDLSGERDVVAVAFAPEGMSVLALSESGALRVWDGNGRALATIEVGESPPQSAFFSRNGNGLVTAGSGEVAVWDLAGNEIARWKGSLGDRSGRSLARDGRLLSIDESGVAHLHGSAGSDLAELGGHTGKVTTATFSGDGMRILTTSEDRTARVWDRTGKPLLVLKHEGPVEEGAFSPFGDRVVTVSGGAARLWRLEGSEPVVLRTPWDPIGNADFSPRGTYVVTFHAGSQSARLWRTTIELRSAR